MAIKQKKCAEMFKESNMTVDQLESLVVQHNQLIAKFDKIKAKRNTT